MEEKITLADLGYKPYFETQRNQRGLGEFGIARVIAQFKQAYTVKDTDREYFAKITGKQIFNASGKEDFPAVGDWVAITKPDNDHATIHHIVPRLTIIKRRYGDKNKAGEKSDVQVIATNIDTAFIIESVDRDYNLNRFERYFSIAHDGGVEAAIVLNKIDLLTEEDLNKKLTQLQNRFPGIVVVLTSTLNNKGLDALRQHIVRGKTYCFLGSSGVGKSSLINKLIGTDAIKTGAISVYSGRGKHITTGRQMYFLKNGGIVIDNPGIREVGMADASKGIDTFFDTITALSEQCRYADCTHTHEPKCAILEALRLGQLNKEQYANYINLKKEADYYEMSDTEKKEKDRQFGKFLQKAKKDFKKLGNKY